MRFRLFWRLSVNLLKKTPHSWKSIVKTCVVSFCVNSRATNTYYYDRKDIISMPITKLIFSSRFVGIVFPNGIGFVFFLWKTQKYACCTTVIQKTAAGEFYWKSVENIVLFSQWFRRVLECFEWWLPTAENV